MKKSRINYVLCLMLYLIVLSFSSCDVHKDNNALETVNEPTADHGHNMPLTDTPITLTVFAGLDSNLIGVVGDYNENGFFQSLEEITGVHLEFIMPEQGKEQELYNEMINSGNLADIITHDGNNYPEGWDAAVEDGYYLDLTPYLDTYLKDYNEVRTSTHYIEKSTLTGNGRVVTFFIINPEPQGPWMGLQVRKDWLDDLGLEIPVTFDDWEEMLTLFKEEKGAYVPLYLNKNGYMEISHGLSAGFHVFEDFMKIDDVVYYGPIEDGWKEYVALLNDWYKKGLIDPDFMTNGTWQVETSMVVNGVTGAWDAMYTMISQYEAADSGISVIPVASPVKNVGDQLHIRKEDRVLDNQVAISTTCAHPEIAMQLLNYLYTEEGSLLANYGVENDTFTYDAKGNKIVTEKISNNENYSMAQAQALYLMPPAKFGGLYDWTRELSALPKKDIEAYDIWSTAKDTYIIPEQIPFVGDEAIERAEIQAMVEAYMNDSTVKFITGVWDIEAEWDNYVATIQELGIERAIEITQIALDRFNDM